MLRFQSVVTDVSLGASEMNELDRAAGEVGEEPLRSGLRPAARRRLQPSKQVRAQVTVYDVDTGGVRRERGENVLPHLLAVGADWHGSTPQPLDSCEHFSVEGLPQTCGFRARRLVVQVQTFTAQVRYKQEVDQSSPG